MAVILVLKTHLILYQGQKAERVQSEMIDSLLTHLHHPRLDWMTVSKFMHSPWPAHLPILPLNMNQPQIDHDLWNKSGPDNFTMITINYAECHKEIGLQCIRILSRTSDVHAQLFRYARSEWINHILNALPSDEILQVLLDNVALLKKEDAWRALKWAEDAEESHKLARQFIMRIQRHLEPPPIEGASARSQSGRGADSESVKESNGDCTSQHKAKHSLIVEIPTKSAVVAVPSRNKVKRRWMGKLYCF
ncbi:hypothetical protein BT96DRAFT_934557 [Gymnopus androsaceus JB14]|uniref:Uncharacterized protein n=1 Tax=Gymnopus androsaceus JB14 TaxID=1447944 RepID=A0A6A4I9Q1_9AGAR|nr:hypothetical protein BT96DRAFT_934557 [Gymnopus androsaceus JB14]